MTIVGHSNIAVLALGEMVHISNDIIHKNDHRTVILLCVWATLPDLMGASINLR